MVSLKGALLIVTAMAVSLWSRGKMLEKLSLSNFTASLNTQTVGLQSDSLKIREW